MIFLEPYKKYADFSGRASKREFFWFHIFLVGAFNVLVPIDFLLMGEEGDFELFFEKLRSPMWLIFFLCSFIPAATVLVRRLHDAGKAGWWAFFAFVTFPLYVNEVNWVYVNPFYLPTLLVLFLLNGTPGDNRFGKNPEKNRSENSFLKNLWANDMDFEKFMNGILVVYCLCLIVAGVDLYFDRPEAGLRSLHLNATFYAVTTVAPYIVIFPVLWLIWWGLAKATKNLAGFLPKPKLVVLFWTIAIFSLIASLVAGFRPNIFYLV